MDVVRHTLSKAERLSGKTAVRNLMDAGKWGHIGHFRFCHTSNGEGFSRIMVSVPKKNFRRAVKRNLLKRRIREAYRLQKNMIPDGKNADILFFYSSGEICSSDVIRTEVAEILQSL